jgi:hypothetical protein
MLRRVLWVALAVTTRTLASAPAFDPASTKNSVVIVSVGMRDAQGGLVYNACERACIAATMWGDVQTVFAASSDGAFGFAPLPVSAIVLVPTDIQLMAAECGLADTWFRAAQAAVPQAAGGAVRLADYTVRVFLYPQEAGAGMCQEGGVSNVRCTPEECNSWLRAFGAALVVHELGHLLGFGHAALGDAESGDLSDPMTAVGALRLFHAPHRILLKWLPCTVTALAPGGKVALQSASGPAALDVGPRALCQVSKADPRVMVVVSGRTAHGVDAALGPPWAPAVYVHVVRTDTWASVCAGFAGVGDTVVARVFPGVNTTVTLVAAQGTAMTVTFAKCLRARPVLVVRAVGRLSHRANVTAVVRNTDTNCPARTIVVKEMGGPPRWKNVTVVIRKDNQPSEISYDVLRVQDGALLVPRTAYTAKGPVQVMTVMTAAAVVVRFYDSFGDGYCCDWGPGGYQVLVNGVVLAEGGRFGANVTVTVDADTVWVFPQALRSGETAAVSKTVNNVTVGSTVTLGVDGTYVVLGRPLVFACSRGIFDGTTACCRFPVCV